MRRQAPARFRITLTVRQMIRASRAKSCFGLFAGTAGMASAIVIWKP